VLFLYFVVVYTIVDAAFPDVLRPTDRARLGKSKGAKIGNPEYEHEVIGVIIDSFHQGSLSPGLAATLEAAIVQRLQNVEEKPKSRLEVAALLASRPEEEVTKALRTYLEIFMVSKRGNYIHVCMYTYVCIFFFTITIHIYYICKHYIYSSFFFIFFIFIFCICFF
jgi:hypothetical protein